MVSFYEFEVFGDDGEEPAVESHGRYVFFWDSAFKNDVLRVSPECAPIGLGIFSVREHVEVGIICVIDLVVIIVDRSLAGYVIGLIVCLLKEAGVR